RPFQNLTAVQAVVDIDTEVGIIARKLEANPIQIVATRAVDFIGRVELRPGVRTIGLGLPARCSGLIWNLGPFVVPKLVFPRNPLPEQGQLVGNRKHIGRGRPVWSTRWRRLRLTTWRTECTIHLMVPLEI